MPINGESVFGMMIESDFNLPPSKRIDTSITYTTNQLAQLIVVIRRALPDSDHRDDFPKLHLFERFADRHADLLAAIRDTRISHALYHALASSGICK